MRLKEDTRTLIVKLGAESEDRDSIADTAGVKRSIVDLVLGKNGKSPAPDAPPGGVRRAKSNATPRTRSWSSGPKSSTSTNSAPWKTGAPRPVSWICILRSGGSGGSASSPP